MERENDFQIENILDYLEEKVENGEITIREAAIELYKAGWTNFIDVDATKVLLKLGE
jgi:hypothetical protein|nr:MAG TPA: hypothetical protein [Caudoviricetes sp.]